MNQLSDSHPAEPSDAAGFAADGAHLWRVRVYYEDTDFSGVVYHARYLHFFERGRTEFLRAAGINHIDLFARPDPAVFALRRFAIDYERPARIDDALTVRTWFLPAGAVRLPAVQELWRGDERLASADCEAVCLTPAGRPRRLPADVYELLAPRLRTPPGRAS